MSNNSEAIQLWSLLSEYTRKRVGMDGAPGKLTLRDIREETGRTADPEGLFEKVLYIESVMYEKIISDYVRKQKR